MRQKRSRKSIVQGTKTMRLNRFKSPEGTRRIGPPFPIKSNTRSQQSMDKINPKEKNGGRHRGGGLGERAIYGQVTKATRPNTSEGVFIPAETGQTGSMDRSDRTVRPVPGTGQTGWSAVSPCTRSHLMAEVLSSKRSLLHDAAILMKIWSMVLEGP